MYFSGPRGSATSRPDRGCGGQYLVPIIIAIPSLIRLRQCLIEYIRTKRGGGSGGTHLANALKYASAFPVIILSALQRNLSLNHTHIGLTETSLYRFWLFTVFVNSFYSFYWDVAKDWDLTLFSSLSRNSPHIRPNHPFGLRPKTFFAPNQYYIAIAIDLLLRCTWSLKLSPHLDHFADFESGIFLMEFLEVGRRWMWIFLRVETEWVRFLGQGGNGVEQEEILLGDYERGDKGKEEGED